MRRRSLLRRVVAPRDRVDLLSAAIVFTVMMFVLSAALFARPCAEEAPEIAPDPEQTALAEGP